MTVNLLIGLGIAAITLLALIVYWITAIVKSFKAGDTAWGILTILFGFIATIYFFVKGHTSLGITNFLFFLAYATVMNFFRVL